jgi:hypothetical protein
MVPLGNSAVTSPSPLEGLEGAALVAAAWEVEEDAATGALLGVGVGVGVGVEEVVGFSTKTAALTALEVGTGVEDGVGTAEVEGAGAGATL